MTKRSERHRAAVTRARLEYGYPHPRREKRHWRKAQGDAVRDAYDWGEGNAMYRRRPIANPFPAGRRHEAFDAGMGMGDAMGDWMGKGV